MATYFGFVLAEVRGEIMQLEPKEFGEKPYFSDYKVGVKNLNWVSDQASSGSGGYTFFIL